MKPLYTVGISHVLHLTDTEEIRTVLYSLLDRYQSITSFAIPDNGSVFIKPNICLVKGHETGTTVDPLIVKCLIDWLNENYRIRKVYVGEADATELNADIAYKALGWETLLGNYPRVEWVNISKDDTVDVPLKGLHFPHLVMSKKYMNADFLISVAKLKTHVMTGITCNLKNIYGANPVKYKAPYHKHLDQVICDLNRVRVPDLCLVDGIISMEGAGPINGAPKPLGLLIIGNNPVAVDHACARIIGLNPRSISHLTLAQKVGIGAASYEVFGTPIRDVAVRFRFVPAWKRIASRIYTSSFIRKNLHKRQRIYPRSGA